MSAIPVDSLSSSVTVPGAPPKPASTSIWERYSADALQLAACVDAAPASLLRAQQHPERLNAVVADRVCSWYLPAFDNAYYGGIMTILRLADYLRRSHGIRQRFLVCAVASRDDMQRRIVDAFPSLDDAEVIILDSIEAIASIPASDYSVATLWTTAYVLLGVDNTGLKFYMIQDFEPAFYPAGSTYAQAEMTYRFGFYGIANSRSIKDIYERQYGGVAVELKPAIDTSVFHADENNRDDTTRRLFCYVRPGAPRNGFELAAAALRIVKSSLQDRVEIVCAGAGWSPEEYGLAGVVRNLGLLPYRETATLYRSCHAGLAMMMSRHPSYLPFELIACGAVVVTNHNEANAWLLRDGENCLCSPASASSLAHTISYALIRFHQLAALRARAGEMIAREHASWDANLALVAEFMFSCGEQALEACSFGNRFLSIRDATFTATELAHFRYRRMGYGAGEAVPGSSHGNAEVPTHDELAAGAKSMEGRIVRQRPSGRGKDDGWYLVRGGTRRWIASPDWLPRNGYRPDAVVEVEASLFYSIPESTEPYL